MVDNLDQATVYNHSASNQTKEYSAEEQKVNLADLPAEAVVGLFDEMEARQVELERQNSDLRLLYADFFDLSPVGYFVLNENGLVLAANSAMANLLTMAKEDLLELPFSSFVAEVDQPSFDMHCRQARETKDRQTCELRLEGNDGNPFFVRLNSVAISDGPNAANGRLATVVMDIGERMQAEAEQERLQVAEVEQLRRAETLGQVLLALTSQTNYKAILDEILAQLRNMVSYSAANIMLLHEGVLRIVRWQGYDSYGSEGLLSTLEQSLAEYPIDTGAVRSQQTVVVPDTHDAAAWVALEGSEWIRSFVAVPICANDQVLGLLRLDSDVPHMFSLLDVERLQPFASAVAIALTHARMYDQSRHELARRNVQAETEIIQLNRKLLTLQYTGATITSSSDLRYVLSTVTKEMAEMINTAGSALYEWDQRRKTVTKMAKFGLDRQWAEGLIAEDYKVADYHLIQRVLVERRPQQITVSHPGVYPAELALMQRANLKSLLMVPMEFQDRVIGFVKVIDTRQERTFSNMEIGLVQLLGNQVANAIENTRLYDQVQQQLSERVEIEKDLRQVAARQQAILNAIPDSLLYFSQDGKLLSYKMVDNYQPLGILEKTIVTRTGDRPSSTNLVDLIRHHLRQVLGSGKMHTFQCRLHLPEGPQQFEIRLVPSGPQEVLAMVRNITKH